MTPEEIRDYQCKWREANPEKVREYGRRQRTKHPKKVKDYHRKWREANPEKRREYALRQRTKHPEKIKARNAVTHAVESGKIIPMPCAICGAEKVEGHHEDYSKPLEVIWLCKKHHTEHHNQSIHIGKPTNPTQ